MIVERMLADVLIDRLEIIIGYFQPSREQSEAYAKLSDFESALYRLFNSVRIATKLEEQKG